jgi:hypothetical protein
VEHDQTALLAAAEARLKREHEAVVKRLKASNVDLRRQLNELSKNLEMREADARLKVRANDLLAGVYN